MSYNSKPVLLIRADADASMGTGHFMRCVALADYLQESFICKLVTKCKIDTLLNISRSVFAEVHTVDNETEGIEVLEESADQWKLVLLDGYAFNEKYQRQLKERDFSIAAIDDILANQTESDIIINHCGGLMPSDYKANPPTLFALGPSYALLRRIFLIPQAKRRIAINDQNCFICFGGADPLNDTVSTLIGLVEKNIFTHFHVVVGTAYQHIEELREYAGAKKNVSLYQAIDANKIKEVIGQCSYAVVSASTVVFEYLAFGGVAWVKMIADNQKYVHHFLTNSGLAFAYDPEQIRIDRSFIEMFNSQQQFFDGKYDQRLKKIFFTWFLSKKIKIRKAEQKDAQLTWEWANDPVVREQSYSAASIPLEDHLSWFSKKIKNPSCYYYILENETGSIAQIRFDDNKEREVTLSYLVASSFRDKGMGSWILSKGIGQLLRDAPSVCKVIGHVKKINIASQRSFEKLRFKKMESTQYANSFTYTMDI
jgi:UDP-2,4-diacetamido-2,4,6-trideoxy-beta-L-altropyranose hydrolase